MNNNYLNQQNTIKNEELSLNNMQPVNPIASNHLANTNLSFTNENLLPIGTVVMLKNGKKRIMITGYLTMPKENQSIIYDYSGCLYPEGILSSDKTIVFNHNQIEKIYFKGYEDEEQKNFMDNLQEILKDNSNN